MPTTVLRFQLLLPIVVSRLCFFLIPSEAQTVSSNALASIESSFTVQNIEEATACNIPKSIADALTSSGFTKCACPFGVLLAATPAYPDGVIKYGANIIANFLDQDEDGEVDDQEIWQYLTYTKYNPDVLGTVMVCGETSSAEQTSEEKFNDYNVVDYGFSCQTYKTDGENEREIKGVMFEETFHMLHTFGWGLAFPGQFGVFGDSFDQSLVCKETERLQCVNPGWWHPENTCVSTQTADDPKTFASSASSPLSGTCNEPNCDCAEFFRQAFTLKVGMTGPDQPDLWYSSYMPYPTDGGELSGETACEGQSLDQGACEAVGCCRFEDGECWSAVGDGACPGALGNPEDDVDFFDLASDEFLEAMEDPQYSWPQTPPSGVYSVEGPQGTAGFSSQEGAEKGAEEDVEGNDEQEQDGTEKMTVWTELTGITREAFRPQETMFKDAVAVITDGVESADIGIEAVTPLDQSAGEAEKGIQVKWFVDGLTEAEFQAMHTELKAEQADLLTELVKQAEFSSITEVSHTTSEEGPPEAGSAACRSGATDVIFSLMMAVLPALF